MTRRVAEKTFRGLEAAPAGGMMPVLFGGCSNLVSHVLSLRLLEGGRACCAVFHFWQLFDGAVAAAVKLSSVENSFFLFMDVNIDACMRSV